MTRQTLSVTHWQTDGNRTWVDPATEYLGIDRGSGLHVFREDGVAGLYAKRSVPISGHQLIRGKYFYEFVSDKVNAS